MVAESMSEQEDDGESDVVVSVLVGMRCGGEIVVIVLCAVARLCLSWRSSAHAHNSNFL